jgi:type I restriction enzyme S subunit
MSVNKEFGKLVRLGSYITQRREKNDNLELPIRGVTNAGFIPPKQLDADTSLYNVFYKYDFVFNPARMELNSISLNLEYDQAICSSLYEIFYVNNTDELLPEYLNLFIKRDEFARFCWYDAIGSARNYFRVANLQEILFPLPDTDIQQEFVDTYNGLKLLAEQNEALSKPLTEACQAYIVDCKKKYPEVELRNYIQEFNHQNYNGEFVLDDVRGVSIQKKFIDTKANMDDVPLVKYKIVKDGMFAFNVNTARMGEKFAIALCKDETYLVSSIYGVFEVIDKSILLPEYLYIIFNREDFDRYVRFNSWGSARETFTYSEICEVSIPLPPNEVQQAIVDIYNCAQEAKNIAREAREKMKNLCPALVQRAING